MQGNTGKKFAKEGKAEMGKGFERHVTFHVLPGNGIEFEDFFTSDYQPAMSQTPGFIKAELLKDTNKKQDLQMVLRFESEEAATSWRASNSHAALKPKLKSLYDGSELKVYQVIV
jgi:heme-degrading monooxygenase HmoA